jgi:hypothetical protein
MQKHRGGANLALLSLTAHCSSDELRAVLLSRPQRVGLTITMHTCSCQPLLSTRHGLEITTFCDSTQLIRLRTVVADHEMYCNIVKQIALLRIFVEQIAKEMSVSL